MPISVVSLLVNMVLIDNKTVVESGTKEVEIEMIYFKACPRCKGDMTLTGDHYGWFKECLMCGYEADVESDAGTEIAAKLVGEVSTKVA